MQEHILLLGAPASGKGTLAKKLIKEGYTLFSASDLLREEVSDKTNPFYYEAKNSLENGILISDEIICQMMLNKIYSIKDEKVVFDGFARTLSQAKLFHENVKKYSIIYLKHKDENTLFQRIQNRLVCNQCATPYNAKNKSEGEPCEECKGTLIRRKDDNLEKMKHRLKEFNEKTLPAINWLLDQNKNKIVDLI